MHRAPPCPWDRRGTRGDSCPTPRGARAAASARSPWRAPDTSSCRRRRAPSTPCAPRRADASGEALVHAVGHEELRVLRPAIGALGQLHLLVSEGLPVGIRGVLLVG